MLLYTNEVEIAECLFKSRQSNKNSVKVSTAEIKDFMQKRYPKENEVTDYDINNIQYEYGCILKENMKKAGLASDLEHDPYWEHEKKPLCV